MKTNVLKKFVVFLLCAILALGNAMSVLATEELETACPLCNNENGECDGSCLADAILNSLEETSDENQEDASEETSAEDPEESEESSETEVSEEETSEVSEEETSEVNEEETSEVSEEETSETSEEESSETNEEETSEVEAGPIVLTAEVDNTIITLTGPASSFENNKTYEIEVSIVEATKEIKAIEEALETVAAEKEKVVESYKAFDIKIIATNEDGTKEEFQPLGPVQVTFSGKEVKESVKNEETETNVIHVDTATGATEDMAAIATAASDVAIETTHFSIYVFVELANPENEKVTLTIEHFVRVEEGGEYQQGNSGLIELPNKFIGNLEDLIAICVSDEYGEDVKLEKVYIEENGSYREVNDEEILTIEENTKIKLEYFLEYEKAVKLNIFSKPGAVKPENTVNKDKTADGLDENDQTNVTLSVGGDETDLGVDIIYIAGSGAARQELMDGRNVMINCLIDTFSEIIKQGTQVNFGIVPFSSTDHAVLDLTPLKTLEDLETLPEKIADAFEKAILVYDGVNMENALVKAKKMFSNSELKDHPERQHLVMISSGLTYFFNGGENNEKVSVVPVRFKNGTKDSNALFYMNKAWQRARTNSTNTYPIPKKIIEAYNKEKPAGITLWEYYWNYIDMWARADIAAGDVGRYDATTVAAGDFISWYNSGSYAADQTYFKYSGYGAVITNPSQTALDNAYVFDMKLGGTDYGPNPLVYEDAAHAILYERAMWEAYQFLQENITGEGISFYPIYNALGATSTNGYVYNGYADQYINHCFMNMLAGGEAVQFSSSDNRAFFDPIKRSILYSVSKGSSVEDYIGYDEVKGNFDFIQEVEDVDINNVINMSVYVADEELDQLDGTVDGKIKYITKKLDTPTEGATSTYTFTRPGATEPTFRLDYYYGNGTTTERFVWTFGEHISKFNPVTLTYKLQLKDKVPSEAVTEETTFVVDTNLTATLYPINSDDNKRSPELFPVPNVEYTVLPPKKTIRIIKQDVTGTNLLAGAEFKLFDATGNQIDLDETTAEIDGVITDSNGVAQFEISKGSYILKETKAPDGYYVDDTQYTIHFENGVLTIKVGDQLAENVAPEVDGIIEITITNIPLYELPEAGGIGNYWYTFSGLLLMIGAGLMFFKYRKVILA